MTNGYDPSHAHERTTPPIPPTLDAEGRCLICVLITRAEDAESALSTETKLRQDADSHAAILREALVAVEGWRGMDGDGISEPERTEVKEAISGTPSSCGNRLRALERLSETVLRFRAWSDGTGVDPNGRSPRVEMFEALEAYTDVGRTK